jgi:hypothetical protein
MTDIAHTLQADTPIGTSQIVCFIPATDRNGQTIDQDYWVDEALTVLGQLFRGATAFPPGKGVWRDDERGGELLFEPTVMVLSYANPADLTDAALLRLRSFLLRLGREANQGEVGLVIDGTYYGFTQFVEAEDENYDSQGIDSP